MATPVERLNAALEGRYRIESELGQGGMATVYLADDLKHERKVALKVLKPELAAVVGAERFLAEIKTTANLQHPHILPLFDSGEADTFLFYVMPYVEGETLRERLDREKELPVEEAVRIASEVADALEYAHGRNVIHRDIKPANILLQGGRVLVADFGIALAVSHAGAKRLTDTGLSVGTPQYMSPEQATGDRELDGRSDLYSLACITYEMLSGDPPYTASTAQGILGKILTEAPKPLDDVRRSVPPYVAAAVHAALEKLPADRTPRAASFSEALRTARPATRAAIGPTRAAPWITAAGLIVAGALGFVTALATRAPEPPLGLTMPSRVTFDGAAVMPRLAPSGDFLAYLTVECSGLGDCRANILVQDLGGGTPVSLDPSASSGVEELGPAWISSLKWSPDGSMLLFTSMFSDSALDGAFEIPRLGGSPRRTDDVFATGGAYRPSGRVIDLIAFPEGLGADPVWRSVDVETGRVSVRPLDVYATTLEWSPDGRWLATAGVSYGADGSTGEIAILSPDGALVDRAPVELNEWPALRWNEEGTGVYIVGRGDLFEFPVDRARGTFAGPRRVVVARLTDPESERSFDVSADGRSIFFGSADETLALHAIERPGFGPVTGRALSNPTGWNQSIFAFPGLSPDGELISYMRRDQLGTNIYVRGFSGGSARALTQTDDIKRYTWWSPDGERIAYLSIEPDGNWLTTVPIQSGRPERLARVPGNIVGIDWTHESDALLYRDSLGQISRVGLDGTATRAFGDPGSMTVMWGLLQNPTGDSLGVIGHRSRGQSGEVFVKAASLGGGTWEEVFTMPLGLADDALETWISDGWTSIWPLGWTSDGIRMVVSHSVGNLGSSSEWLVSPGERSGIQTLDLTPLCSAPTQVAMDRSGNRLVCTNPFSSFDIWRLDLR